MVVKGENMDGILDTIKKMLGIDPTDTSFDTDVITLINSAFMNLEQLNVGPFGGFSIKDNSAKWTDFLGSVTNQEAAKTYIYLKVKMVFDPPASSTVLEAYNRESQEVAYRLMMQAEPPSI